MSNQLLRDFQTDNLCDREQLEIEVKNVVVCKTKRISGKFSEIGAGTKKGQFGLGYGQKIQSKNPI